jgi:hypothetical protein
LFIGQVLNPRRVAATLVKLSNFKEDISDNDDKYKLPSMKKRSSQDFSYERYVKRFRNRLRYVTLFGKKHDPLIIVECLSLDLIKHVLQLVIEFDHYSHLC